jgi:hypothetical protein
MISHRSQLKRHLGCYSHITLEYSSFGHSYHRLGQHMSHGWKNSSHDRIVLNKDGTTTFILQAITPRCRYSKRHNNEREIW